jgi:uncharacterized protein with beta-barrel porin domain
LGTTGINGARGVVRGGIGLLSALVLVSSTVLPGLAAVGPGGATNTSTTSETRSGTATVNGSGNPGVAAIFSGPQGGMNAAALATFLPSTSFSKTSLSLGFDTSTTFADTLTGPVPIPVGIGPGTVNCTTVPAKFGTPTATGKWPYPECNYAGYQILMVQPGTVNINTNEHFVDTYTITISGAALNWLQGSLHTTVPNTLIDGGASFIEKLMAHGGSSLSELLAPQPIAYRNDTLSTPALDQLTAVASASSLAPVDIGAWFAAIPRTSRYTGSGVNFGYSAGGAAMMGGFDQNDGAWRYGIAFSLEGDRVVEDTTGDTGTIGTGRLGAYAAYELEDWTVTGAVALGLHQIDTTRLVALPSPSTASYRAATVTAALDATGHYEFGPAVFEPTAGIVLSSISSEAFTETGPLGIAGQAATTSSLKVYAGGKISGEVVDAGGHVWTPDVHGRLTYDVLNDPRDLTATFVGAPTPTPFVVSGITPSPWSLALGTALQVQLSDRYMGAIGYDAMLRGGAISHAVSFGANGTF